MRAFSTALIVCLLSSLVGAQSAPGSPTGSPPADQAIDAPPGRNPLPVAGGVGSLINQAPHQGMSPFGTAISQAFPGGGAIYVNDLFTGQTHIYDLNLNPTPPFQIPSPGGLDTHTGIAFDPSGNELFWIDVTAQVLFLTDPNGTVLNIFPLPPVVTGGLPGGLTLVDFSATLWVNEIVGNQYIELFLDGTPTGNVFPSPVPPFGNGIAHVPGTECFDLPVGDAAAMQVDTLVRFQFPPGVPINGASIAFVPDTFINGNVFHPFGSQGGALGPVNYLVGNATNSLFEIDTFDDCIPPPLCAPVADLSCVITDVATVTLSWNLPVLYDQHEIFRDGTLIATLGGGDTSFVDSPVVGPHTYDVVSTCPGAVQEVASCDVDVPIIIPPGGDAWNTDCGRTSYSFCENPIPSDFFEPGSQPFDGKIRFEGAAGPTGVDTVIERFQEMVLPDPDSVATTPIQLVELSLVSCEPITVVVNGADTLWDVAANLSPDPVPPGTMTVTREHVNGGVFEAEFFVKPVFVFTRVNPPGPIVVLDTLTEELFITQCEAPWVHIPDTGVAPVSFPGFVPGVEEDPIDLDQCCRKVGHSSGTPGHIHETGPPDCSACPGACWNKVTLVCTPNSPPPPMGCTGPDEVFLGPGTSCADCDNDGLPDIVETNDCCRGFIDACDTGTDPFNPDTDGDGVSDRDEILAGTNPCCSSVTLTCTNNDPVVDLMWINNAIYAGHDIFRNGALIATLLGTDSSFSDMPGPGMYTYEVRSLCASGGTDSATCNVDLSPPGTPIWRGDCDGDGAFNGVLDGLRALNFQFIPGTPAPPCLAQCDADSDRVFNGVLDGIYMLNFQFIPGSPPIGPPFPCGLEPVGVDSVGQLGCATQTCP